MRSEHITYFIALAETSSITKAGLMLHTTHQNVSKVIRQLEDEMATKLFTRTQKGLILTESGKIMLNFAQQTVEQFAKTRAAIITLENSQTVTGELYLYGSNAINLSYLFSLLQSFNEQYPKVAIRMNEWDPIDILQTIALHPNQVGVVPIMVNPDFYDIYEPYLDMLAITPLADEQFLCIISNQLPLAQKKNVALAEFVQYPIAFLQNSIENTPPLVTILKRFGKPEVGLICSNIQLYTNTLLSGRYVGFSTHRAHSKNRSSYNSQLICIPFQEDMRFQVCLITHKKPNLTPTTQAFIDFIHDTQQAT